MVAQLTQTELRNQQAREVLLGHFLTRGPAWPGADSLTIEEVLHSYPAYAAAGQVPGQQELVRRFPELANELNAFFNN